MLRGANGSGSTRCACVDPALTDGYEVPEGACNTWRALWFGLADLETSLHQHIHLETTFCSRGRSPAERGAGGGRIGSGGLALRLGGYSSARAAPLESAVSRLK